MTAHQPIPVYAAGMIEVDPDGILHVRNWVFDDSSQVPKLCHGWSKFAGWSVRELHEMSHGGTCCCPVLGFEPCIGGVTLRYGQRPPYVIDSAECTAMEGQS